MKTMLRNINILLILVMAFPIIAISCSDDDSSAANLSFSRSIYILPSSGSLEVELRASVPPETDLIVPVNIEGTAELNEDYEISAKEFTIKAVAWHGTYRCRYYFSLSISIARILRSMPTYRYASRAYCDSCS